MSIMRQSEAFLETIFRKSSGGYKPRFKPLIPHHKLKMAGVLGKMTERMPNLEHGEVNDYV